MKKLCLQLRGRRTYIQLLKFWLFNFFNFYRTLVKNFLKKVPGFKIDFESTDKVLLLHQYLWSEISRQWNNRPLKFFLKFPWKSNLLLKFFSNKGNIKASILQILLKCIVVGYFNGNKSFTGRLSSNYRLLNMLFHFFDISFLVFLIRLLAKSLWRNCPF